MTPYITHKTIFRETPLTVTLRADGTVLSVTFDGKSVTTLIGDAGLVELAQHCRKERRE